MVDFSAGKGQDDTFFAGVIVAGLLIGAAVAGFFDGIVLHQILQWHHLICRADHCQTNSIADLKLKDRQDGYFHAFCLLLLLLGVGNLYRQAEQPVVAGASRILTGATLFGMGLFNFLEGLIDHEILGIHHVRPGPSEGAWDIGFLVLALLLMLAGWQTIGGRRTGVQAAREAGAVA